jgi:alpha-tubulin suppressor-like RCC1 family protein
VVDGAARCWGRNQAGQLGSSAAEDPTSQPLPVAVLRETDQQPLTGVTEIATAPNFTCAATSAPDELWCWGENVLHALGDGSAPESPDGDPAWLARKVDLDPGAAVIRLAAGGHGACALLEGGDLWCWGANDHGQVGAGSAAPWLPPTRVLTGASDVALGHAHACAVLQGGALSCWGDNVNGELGDGTTNGSAQPTPVAPLCP